MPLNGSEGAVGKGVLAYDVILPDPQAALFRTGKEMVPGKGAVIAGAGDYIRAGPDGQGDLLRESAPGAVFQVDFKCFFDGHIAEHVAGTEQVHGHRINPREDHSLRLFNTRQDSLMIEVNGFNSIDYMDHESALTLYGLKNIDHGGIDAGGFSDQILSGIISFRNAVSRVHLGNPDMMRNPSLHSRQLRLGQAIIPFEPASLRRLHGVKPDSQVFFAHS